MKIRRLDHLNINDFSKLDFEKIKSFIVDNNLTVFNNLTIIPGFTDVHVHLREPGFSYKETIYTGSRACAKGGYTSVFTMPNLNPVPDSIDNINVQLDIINKDSVINIYPYASITKGELGKELSDMEELKDLAIAFSDDGRGVQDELMMRSAMIKAKELDKIIVAHCEVNELLKGGYIHEGDYAKKHNHKGICSASEYKEIERDIKLAKEIGCKFHVCHISCKESVELIRNAKKDGVDITCETAPHYLILSDKDLKEDGYYKMNPPLRSEEDRLALIEGILDGTIDMIATDHAPHSEEEKSKGLEKSLFGIVGIETAFPLLHEYLVKTNIISIEKLLDLLIYNPNKRFNIETKGFSIWNLEDSYLIDNKEFISKGKATPFNGYKVSARNLLTVNNDKVIYKFIK